MAHILSSSRLSALGALSALACCAAAIAQPDGAQRLAPPQSDDPFFADAARIKPILDGARKEAPPGGGIYSAFDE